MKIPLGFEKIGFRSESISWDGEYEGADSTIVLYQFRTPVKKCTKIQDISSEITTV